MVNRVIVKILKNSVVLSFTASVVLLVYILQLTRQAPPVAVRRQAADANGRRDGAPLRYRLLETQIVPTAAHIRMSDQLHQVYTLTAKPRLYQAATHPPLLELSDSGPAHSVIETEDVGLPYDAASQYPREVSGVATRRPRCAPTPYQSSDIKILGRRMERCIPDISAESGFTRDSIYITIKTTQANHKSRLLPLILTWLQTVQPEQVHIVTDNFSVEEEFYIVSREVGFHVTESGCKQSHLRKDLCCKTGAQYSEYFTTIAERVGSGIKKPYKWFCHFDDDIYVNIPMLVNALHESTNQTNRSDNDLYFGRWPIEMVFNPKLKNGYPVNNKRLARLGIRNKPRMTVRWATGAAYCLSSSLLQKMEHYFNEHTYQDYCNILGINDDLVPAVLAASEGSLLHSDSRVKTHYDELSDIPTSELQKQITISYSIIDNNTINSTTLAFSPEEDPTRFLFYHCLIYPSTSWCRG